MCARVLHQFEGHRDCLLSFTHCYGDGRVFAKKVRPGLSISTQFSSLKDGDDG